MIIILLSLRVGRVRYPTSFTLYARSGFTPQGHAEAAARSNLLLFDLPRIVKG